MNRRRFVATTVFAVTSAVTSLAHAGSAIDYTPGLVQERLAAGETVLLDFKASWCSTCAAQARVIDNLKASNPVYEEKITFIDVDWDEYGRSSLTRNLSIPRRSTLVLLRDGEELGRIVAGTSAAVITELLDRAL